MFEHLKSDLDNELDEIRKAGLYKDERIILSDQKADITVSFPRGAEPRQVLNFCANNYLGLANHPKLLESAHRALDRYGFGMASVRFICGTQDVHKELEERVAAFYETEDTILYSSCFDANGGLFECILGADDAIVTDALNHASIIDGIRLCKAKRFIYDHSDMGVLEERLKEAVAHGGRIMIATDGVFSMDGDVANLKDIVVLAKKYNAMVMVDDSHATGFFGEKGRGSVEYCGVLGEIDVITSTLGKAMGGASGGFTTGRKEIIDMLRQRSRPYLFSNTMAPVIAATSVTAFDLLSEGDALRKTLMDNTAHFRTAMTDAGFDIIEGVHPIVPIMFRHFENDAELSQQMARDLYEEGIYVIGFFFPVVPRKQSRIRVQLSAAHSRDHVSRAVEAFIKVGKKHKVI